MSLVTKALSNLYNGVSQQAPSIRMTSQGEVQTNGFSSIVEGLKKRPPTEYVAKILDTLDASAHVHVINRDTSEQYVVVTTYGNIQIWDTKGNQKTVNAPNGFGYLLTSNAQQDIQCVTVADHTFVLNKSVTTTMLGGAEATLPSVEYRTITLLQPSTSYNYEYVITVGSKTYTLQLWASGTLTSMVKTLSDKIAQDNPTFTVGVADSNVIKIAAKNTGVSTPGVTSLVRAFTQTTAYQSDIDGTTPVVTTSYSGDYSAYVTSATFTSVASESIKGSKQLFSDLPTTGNTIGDIWVVQGDPNNGFTAYYCQWNGGAWVETVLPGLNNTPMGSTMPHLLVREADGTFTFKPATWDQRTVGDLTTAPNPSFIDRTISGVFFYRNRLGFMADENVIFSKAGDFFNFFRGSATVVLDDDPIDVSVSHTKVSMLKHAIPFNKNLLLFSEQTQFVLTSEDNLTPSDVAIHQTTEFGCSAKVTPVASGSNCYFATEDNGWASIREYFVQPLQSINDADDITAHVPTYIPAGVVRLAASTNEDVVIAHSEGDPKALYVYKYYWKGDEKLQSSWSRWEFAGDVVSMEILSGTLMLCLQYDDGVYLESMNLQEGAKDYGMPITVHLDRKVRLLGSYDVTTDTTRWTLPYPSDNAQLVMDGAFGVSQGQKLPITYVTPTVVSAAGDWTDLTEEGKGYAIVGVPYTFIYRFSPQYPKDKNNNPLARAKAKIRNWSVFYNATAYFRAEVSSTGRDTVQHYFTGKRVGQAGMVLGTLVTSSGKFSFPVWGDAMDVTIDLINDSFLPCFFQSAEYEGFIVQRAKVM